MSAVANLALDILAIAAHRDDVEQTCGGTLIKAFASVGWKWGGRWSDNPDYQHFSKTGG